QVLILHAGRAFDGAGGIDVADDGVDLLRRVTQFPQRQRYGVVHDLDHAAADQFLVFHQRQVRFNAGGVAIHHEADGADGRQHRALRVAITGLFAQGQSFVPAALRAFVEVGGNILFINVVDRSPVHADDVQERLAVDVPARAGAAADVLRRDARRGRSQAGAL